MAPGSQAARFRWRRWRSASRSSRMAARGRSPQLRRIAPRPQPLLPYGRRDLDPRPGFVGRGEPLTRLNLEWLKAPDRAVALVQGLAGLGKTALAAEAIHLWHDRFDWVLCRQTREPASADDFYRDLDLRLSQHSSVYGETCRDYPAGRIWLPPGDQWTGTARFEQMRTNLLQALAAEAILLVLDNFESNLAEPGSSGPAGPESDPAATAQARPPAHRDHPCRDPEWDRLLAALAEGLPGTRSRLLVTSRHRPAALFRDGTAGHVTLGAGALGNGGARVLWLPVGPLPIGEAVLFMRQCPALADLIHGPIGAIAGDGPDLDLARRVLDITRGHPLILERLCTLAPDRADLAAALDTLGADGGYGRLPDLFARGRGLNPDPAELERERRYLEDVAVGAVDLLLRRQSPEARRLLWLLALAGEPVEEGMLAGVWSGRSAEDEAADRLRQLLSAKDGLPEALRAQLDSLPPGLLAALESRPPPAPVPPWEPLLAALHAAGLVYRESDPGPWTCHELVRERALAWMADRPQERAGRSAEQVLVAYAERFEALFRQLLASGAENARDAAVLAGRRALGLCVRAGALERLGGFASTLVANTRDPRLLDGVVRELQSVAERVAEGRPRWSLRTYIADGLRMAGRPDESLPFYEQAAAEAESAGHWADLAAIANNWANALGDAGHPDAAKAQYRASAEADRKADSPEIAILTSELEALRIEVMQGQAERVRPEIEGGLARIRGWWERSRSGETVPEAPDGEFLGRAMTGALDIAQDAARTLEDWEGTLALLDELESVDKALGQGEHERARTRFNRYGPLLRLGRLPEAQSLLEDCFAVFRRFDDVTMQAKTLSALADLWDARDDRGQAADLERRALDLSNRLPDPGDRAISHNNLALYLDRQGETRASARHRLAALCIDLVCGYGHLLRGHVRNLSIDLSEAKDRNEPDPLPTLDTLLADPEFDPLRRFLAERAVPLPELQRTIDDLLAQAP